MLKHWQGYWLPLLFCVCITTLVTVLSVRLTWVVWQHTPVLPLDKSSAQQWGLVITAWLCQLRSVFFLPVFLIHARQQRMVNAQQIPVVFFHIRQSLVFLLVVSLMTVTFLRLVSVFELTAYNLSLTRIRVYICLITVMCGMELTSMFVGFTVRWYLWISSDVFLFFLSLFLCIEFTSRLFRVIRTLSDKDGMIGQHLLMQRPLNESQIRLFRVATKMTVLTIFLCLSVLHWGMGVVPHLLGLKVIQMPLLRVWLGTNIEVAVSLYAYLSLKAGDPMYRFLCGRTGHPLVLGCLMSREQSEIIERRISLVSVTKHSFTAELVIFEDHFSEAPE